MIEKQVIMKNEVENEIVVDEMIKVMATRIQKMLEPLKVMKLTRLTLKMSDLKQ
jgi:hypothetical protein